MAKKKPELVMNKFYALLFVTIYFFFSGSAQIAVTANSNGNALAQYSVWE
ncbi:MAG: hypothetical protein NTY88_13995 [Bacteroidetes bacterium]|nr:hypothetical protein [Bacteroidota bacterium]